jgi:hypothetical protein
MSFNPDVYMNSGYIFVMIGACATLFLVNQMSFESSEEEVPLAAESCHAGSHGTFCSSSVLPEQPLAKQQPIDIAGFFSSLVPTTAPAVVLVPDSEESLSAAVVAAVSASASHTDTRRNGDGGFV